jgi:hypothetical protein
VLYTLLVLGEGFIQHMTLSLNREPKTLDKRGEQADGDSEGDVRTSCKVRVHVDARTVRLKEQTAKIGLSV